jgi:hypothetical protein
VALGVGVPAAGEVPVCEFGASSPAEWEAAWSWPGAKTSPASITCPPVLAGDPATDPIEQRNEV